ncbi:hypothetical protein ANO11243_094950 [Dothideomycetidae sp. 11243]|nr:hypothetical protein ANO11243_094950 [fungal sp. No.11243]
MESTDYDDDGLYASDAPQAPVVADRPSSDDAYLDDLNTDNEAGSGNDTRPGASKRLLDDADEVPQPKRVRFDTPRPTLASLSLPVLQHILGFLAPSDLITCLHVNRRMRQSLTIEHVPITNNAHTLSTVDGNEIWRTSRTLFLPQLQDPLEGLSEMQMLFLLLGNRCEQCNQPPTFFPPKTVFWNYGPGRNGSQTGVRIIWPFGIRLCGTCFESSTAKDVDLIITPDNKLLPGLPHVMRTADTHYVPPSLMPSKNSSVPSSVQMSKVFYIPGLGKLREVQNTLSAISADAVERWLANLRESGKRKLVDAARWVDWEASLPPHLSPRQAILTMMNFHTTVSRSFVPTDYSYTGEYDPMTAALTNTQPGSHLHGSSATNSAWVSEKMLMDRRLAARKEQIERRCMEEIVPPLLPNALEHISQFKDALKIPRELTEEDWLVLKPRLLQHRLAAEQHVDYRARNFDSTQYVNSITQRTNRRAQPGAFAGGDPKNERAQKPVRKLLVDIAQQVLDERWRGGTRLSKMECPNFAADIIISTLSRFRNSTEAAQFEMGHEITLETVKHLFDMRIKPFMEKLSCKEMFQCADCEESIKWYTFDGMMQHSGAKHDYEFSVGNVVVAWQHAIWPEIPPFVAHPVRNRRIPPSYADAALPGRGTLTVRSRTPETARATPTFSDAAVPTRSITPEVAQVNPANSDNVHGPSFLTSLLTSFRQPEWQRDNHKAGVSYSDNDEEYEPTPVGEQSIISFSTKASSTLDQINAGLGSHLSNETSSKSSKPKSLEKREEIVKLALDLLKRTGGMPQLEDSVRLFVVLGHTSTLYCAHFTEELTLGQFQDALSHHEMKPLRKFANLACNPCVQLAAGEDASPQALTNAKKSYNISQLLSHFQLAHANGLSFLTGMLRLPEVTTLRSIPYMKGITQDKLGLIASTLPPFVFPTGTPAAQPPLSPTVAADNGHDSTDNASQPIPLAGAKHKNDKRLSGKGHWKSKRDQRRPDDDDESSMPEAGEDEYDPRRPSMPAAIVESRKHDLKPSLGQSDHKKRSSSGKYFDYYASEIPDVIRTEVRNGSEGEAAQHGLSADQHSSTQLVKHPQVHAARAPSPPRYFDQYGNPVSLETMTPVQPQHQQPMHALTPGLPQHQQLMHVAQPYGHQPVQYGQPYAAFGAQQPGYGQALYLPPGAAVPQYQMMQPMPGYGQYQTAYPPAPPHGHHFPGPPQGPQPAPQYGGAYGPPGPQFIWETERE